MKNKLCKNCWKWKEFGTGCKYFWPDKIKCTQFKHGPESSEEYKSVGSLTDYVERVKKVVDTIRRTW